MDDLHGGGGGRGLRRRAAAGGYGGAAEESYNGLFLARPDEAAALRLLPLPPGRRR